MSDERKDMMAVSPGELRRWLSDRGQPAYRLGQILEWVWRRHVASFEEMSNVSLPLRGELAGAFALSGLREADRTVSGDRATEKFLFELSDGERIEAVWMGGRPHDTCCVSSQAGCALGCRFCATGSAGFARNLTVGEILGQVTALARGRGWPANVVFMGMGEPLLNMDALFPALAALTDEQRFGLGGRRITVSTAGVPAGIRALARSPARPNLALSLNSPFEGQRSELMPINRKYPLSEVLPACKEYAERAGRRLVLEYVLLGGVNTSLRTARALVRIARDLGALVNLIPFNPVRGCGFRGPTGEERSKFRGLLEKEAIAVAERFRRGRDIAAGCGQLTGRHAQRAGRASAPAGPEQAERAETGHEPTTH